jgi:ABC-2 type transport system permease protein
MKWNRIEAVVIKTWYNMQRDIFRIFDIFYWPAFELFIWGLFSIFISKTSTTGLNIVNVLLGGVILWTFFDRASRDISIALIDELWNRNFVNLFSTPLTIGEYITGVTIVASIKLVISMLFMLFLASILYGFKISAIGYYVIPAAFGLTIFGWTLSFVVQAFILKYGHTVEVFIWAIAILAQPLSCVFYPLSVLPEWAKYIAYMLPSTYLFENMRQTMAGGGVNYLQILLSFILNLIYLILALIFFYKAFAHAKVSGNLIKNY